MTEMRVIGKIGEFNVRMWKYMLSPHNIIQGEEFEVFEVWKGLRKGDEPSTTLLNFLTQQKCKLNLQM